MTAVPEAVPEFTQGGGPVLVDHHLHASLEKGDGEFHFSQSLACDMEGVCVQVDLAAFRSPEEFLEVGVVDVAVFDSEIPRDRLPEFDAEALVDIAPLHVEGFVGSDPDPEEAALSRCCRGIRTVCGDPW